MSMSIPLKEDGIFPPKQSQAPDTENSTPNPLDLDHIIHRMVKHLSLSDLKNCRLVNKMWNTVTGKVITPKSGIISFHTDPRERARMFTFIHLLDTYPDASVFPFRKFAVMSDMLLRCKPEERSLLLTFFVWVAAWVTHLEIESGFCKLIPLCQHPIRLEFLCLESLNLGLKYYETTPDGVVASNVHFFVYILYNSPNLTTLGISYDLSLMPAFEHLLEHVPYSRLLHLKIHGCLTDNHLNYLLQRELTHLETLELKVINDYQRGRPLALSGPVLNFFLQQSGSLETLTLDFDNLEFFIKLDLPPLPKLKTLHLRDNCVRLGLELSEIWYSHQLPALKALSLSGKVARTPEIFFNSSQVVEGVETLEVSPEAEDQRLYECGRRAVRFGAKAFPNLRKLVVPAHVNVMEAIRKQKNRGNLQRLETLGLFERAEFWGVDSALTGYTLAECTMIDSMTSRLFHQVKKTATIWKFLHELKTLEVKPVQQTNQISQQLPILRMNLSCQWVLLQLKNLKCLDLRAYRHFDAIKICPEILRDMKKKFEVLHHARAIDAPSPDPRGRADAAETESGGSDDESDTDHSN